MLVTNYFSCVSLFTTGTIHPGRCGVSYLNWDCKSLGAANLATNGICLSDLRGPGIYGLCFRENVHESDWRLIYIGSYCGITKPLNPFGGNVAQVRWWTHLASVTMRGCRVSISCGKINSLVSILFGGNQSAAAGDPMFGQLMVPRLCLCADNGCVTSVNRAVFSYKHKGLFLHQKPTKLLEHFKFVYVRLTSLPHSMQSGAVIQKIRAAEKDLIKRLCPQCNHVKTAGCKVNCDEATRSILAAMEGVG